MVHGTGRAGTRRRRSGRRSRGVALVEFALVAPLLFLLVFGIIEFGWAFMQSLDVRHGAREGARLAAVNFKTTAAPTPSDQTSQLIAEVCDRIDAPTGVLIELTFQDGPDTPTPDLSTNIGDRVTVKVIDPDLDTLTGFFDVLLSSVDLESTVRIRLEQAATFAPTPIGGQACP